MSIENDIPVTLSLAAKHMRKLASDNAALYDSNQRLAHELRLHKIAMRMEERSLDPGVPLQEKVAQLQEFPPNKLDSLEQAIELSAGGFKLGSLQEADRPSEGSNSSYAELTSFILSGEAYR